MATVPAELVLFSWGYWGWGSATREFVEAADALEKSKGFDPPVFVDARLKRSVRAAGFRDSAFEQLVGPDRYRWMKGLGNKKLGQGGAALADPEDVEKLLELALGEKQRRFIFFCACKVRLDGGKLACHRSLVTTELVRRAKLRRQPISVVEWPGTALNTKPFDWDVTDSVLKALGRGGASFCVEQLSVLEASSVAWGAPVRLHAGSATISLLSGPASFQKKRWVQPVRFRYGDESPTDQELGREAQSLRHDFGYDPEASTDGAALASR